MPSITIVVKDQVGTVRASVRKRLKVIVPDSPDFSLPSVFSVDNIYESLKDLGEVTPANGARVVAMSFYARTLDHGFDGGGSFVYDADRLSADHDGCFVVARNAIAAWDGTAEGVYAFLNWEGNAEKGCYVRTHEGGAYDAAIVGVTRLLPSSIDASPNLNRLLVNVGESGGGDIVCSASDNDLFIANSVTNEYSNVSIDIKRRIAWGEWGHIRIFGRVEEYRKDGYPNLARLSADSYTNADGRLVLPIADGYAASFVAGDRVIVRGEQDAFGNSVQKMDTIVHSVVGNEVVCVDAVDTTEIDGVETEWHFLTEYPDSAWPDDRLAGEGTRISFVVSTLMTQDLPAGEFIVPVQNASIFDVGQVVKAEDQRVENDIDARVPYKNRAVMEYATIVAIDLDNNTVTLDRALKRSYSTAWNAAVSKVSAVRNSHVKLADSYWVEPQIWKVHVVQCIYGYKCSVDPGHMEGSAGRAGAGVRIGDSYACWAEGGNVENAAAFFGGAGYGYTIYYSTLCEIRYTRASGNRHNYLVQACVDAQIHHNISNDDWISGIDVHGVQALATWIHHNELGRSTRLAGVNTTGAIRIGNSSHAVGDHDSIVEHNVVDGYRMANGQAAAVDVVAASKNTIIRSNTFRECDIGVRASTNRGDILPSPKTNLITVDDNDFYRVDMKIDTGRLTNGLLDLLVLTNNRDHDTSGDHFVIDGTARNGETEPRLRHLKAANNQLIHSDQTPLRAFIEALNVPKLDAWGNQAEMVNGAGLGTSGVSDGYVVRNCFGRCGSDVTSAPSDTVIEHDNS